jgi:lipopolysaccharide export system protein LptC
MSLTRTEGGVPRVDIFGRLIWRNRLVGLLRIVVPAIGLVAFAILAAQIYIANIARQYGVSGIRIDRGNLVVETPQYSGIGADGSRYVVNASEARTPIDNTRLISMSQATLDYTRPGGTAFHVTASEATMDTAGNVVTVPGVATVVGSDGLHGTLTRVRSDMTSQITTANGAVDLTFSDGTTLLASNMHYDGNAALWVFENATVTMPDLPQKTPAEATPSP